MDMYPSSPAILDGGLGTTLEEVFKVDVSRTPLWSAEQILESPETIVNAHLAFLRSGARIILTATYQCSPDSFKRAGRSISDYESALIQAVALANKARSRYAKENPKAGDIRIALSLGPYGANLYPAQEFTGYYPPPYGPQTFVADGENYTSFGTDTEATRKSIEALTEFHLNRLLIVSRSPEAWKNTDIIAFETIPLRRELVAVRRAIHQLQSIGGSASNMRPWWTTFTLPEGKCPETLYPGGPSLTVDDLVHAALDKNSGFPTPTAIGINCTSPTPLPQLVYEMSRATSQTRHPGQKPWLVLYPNRGYLYDSESKAWKGDQDALPLEETLNQVWKEIRRNYTSSWGGFVFGGCCGTGPAEIKQLAESFGV